MDVVVNFDLTTCHKMRTFQFFLKYLRIDHTCILALPIYFFIRYFPESPKDENLGNKSLFCNIESQRNAIICTNQIKITVKFKEALKITFFVLILAKDLCLTNCFTSLLTYCLRKLMKQTQNLQKLGLESMKIKQITYSNVVHRKFLIKSISVGM